MASKEYSSKLVRWLVESTGDKISKHQALPPRTCKGPLVGFKTYSTVMIHNDSDSYLTGQVNDKERDKSHLIIKQ